MVNEISLYYDARSKKHQIQIQNFIKIRPEGAELFLENRRTYQRTERQTEMMKLIVGFHNFVTAPKIVEVIQKFKLYERRAQRGFR